MNYEFHVGDYIENRKGDVGWVTSVTDEKIVWKTNTGRTYVMEVPTLNRVQCPEALFVRIGAYDFTKKEKKNIKTLNLQGYLSTQTIASVVNELVDAVNKLMDKEEDR